MQLSWIAAKSLSSASGIHLRESFSSLGPNDFTISARGLTVMSLLNSKERVVTFFNLRRSFKESAFKVSQSRRRERWEMSGQHLTIVLMFLGVNLPSIQDNLKVLRLVF